MHSTAATASKAIIEIQPGARSAPTRSAQPVGGQRGERAVELCEGMIDIVAALFNVSGKELRRPGRTDQSITRVRQIAMYVSHVVLRLSMNEVGHGFGRDRTTVLHACHLIEDMRDDEDFDCLVARTERVALAAFRNRLGL
ncbi:helix-turn-helix domain-containing protein [Allomesorhizobium camelthorni]|uniref:helix-turn-helix domain-containing protein n=1 Tax=Allomesorhizobium camelthorni TaxID=475069 RepID=UPI0031B5A026